MDAAWFAGFTSDLHNATLWNAFYLTARAKVPLLPRHTPPLPAVDGEFLFWEMMRGSRAPDPWMYPALQALRASGAYILGALSNTVIFPPGHVYNDTHREVKALFDVFVSSAHVGLRKPDPRIYEYTLEALDRFARESGRWGGGGVRATRLCFWMI